VTCSGVTSAAIVESQSSGSTIFRAVYSVTKYVIPGYVLILPSAVYAAPARNLSTLLFCVVSCKSAAENRDSSCRNELIVKKASLSKDGVL
jgi:hypothetical protein